MGASARHFGCCLLALSAWAATQQSAPSTPPKTSAHRKVIKKKAGAPKPDPAPSTAEDPSTQPPTPPRPLPLELHLKAAADAEARKDLAAAESEYKQALVPDPHSQTALGGLAFLYLSQHREPEAEAVLREYVKTDPENASAHEQLGATLLALKKDDAIAEMQVAWNKAASDPKLRRRIANEFAAHGRYPQAEAAFGVLLKQQPNDADLMYAYAITLMNQRKMQPAQLALQKTLSLKPDLADAYGDLAVVAASNQNYALTLQALDDRAKYLPETPATWFLRATSFDHLHDLPRAAESYHRFLNLDGGKSPDQEWQARHRLLAIEKK